MGSATKARQHDKHLNGSAPFATFNEHRALLFSIAYRMVGTVTDAEDLLQDTFIRWQQAAAENDIRSPKAFLITTVSRLCINHLQSARVQREEYVGEWLPEPLATDAASDPLGVLRADESISMAFLVMLERLTPVERAVFLLRETFDYKFADIAAVLGLEEANCRQILRRAHQHVQARPRFTASLREHDDLLDRFREATRNGDMGQLLALLADDVVLHADGGGRAGAVPNVLHGSTRIARGILGGLRKLVPRNLVQRIIRINGHSAVVSYLDGHPHSVLTLNVGNGRIQAVYIVTNPDKLVHLPPAPI